MNELGMAVAWSALQVTVVAVAALLLDRLFARRGGTTTAALGLGLSLALGVAAFCPLPRWWSCHAWGGKPMTAHQDAHSSDAGSVRSAASVETTVPEALPAEAVNGLPVAPLLDRLWQGVRQAVSHPPQRFGRWPGTVGVLFLLGAALSVGRLLLGLWGVRGWRRQSRAVDDPALLHTASELCRALGCARPVEVRESADVPSAATVGWLRPLVLLPSDWRSWGESERQAVLAHELAHVCRRDYLVGLLARLCVALHFYHPLVYRLAGRLHLRQELAADALGARFAGGRGPYLAALARLALRQEVHLSAGPARAFLPARGTLLRRIAMLRGKEAVAVGRLGRCARGLTGAVLLGVGLTVSALRAPAHDESPAPDEGRPAAGAKQTEDRPPFDLTYAPDDAVGFWAFRPAAFARRCGGEAALKFCNAMMGQCFLDKGGKSWAHLGLSIEDIEEVSGGVHLLFHPEAPEGAKRSIALSFSLVRVGRPFDWKEKIRPLATGFEEVQYKGRVYYKSSKPAFEIVGTRLAFITPDDRTIVYDTEANVRRLLDRAPDYRPGYVWKEKWGAVERSLFAVALDTRNTQWAQHVTEKDMKDIPELNFLTRNVSRWVAGIDHRGSLRVQAFARCESGEAADRLVELAKAGVSAGKGALKLAKPPMQAKFAERLLQCGENMLISMIVTREAETVSWKSEAPLDLADIVELLKAELPLAQQVK